MKTTVPEPEMEASRASARQTRLYEEFAAIVDAHQARLVGFLRRMVGNPEDAADLAQEVFVRAFQSYGSFDGRSSVKTWLFRIAHNLCIDRSRRRSARHVEASLDDHIPDAASDPEQHCLANELVALVEAKIAGMSDKLKAVLLLHDKEEMAYEEIAKALGIPVGTVKSRLFLAREQIAEAIAEYRQGGGYDG